MIKPVFLTLVISLLMAAQAHAQNPADNPAIKNDWIFGLGWQQTSADASIGLGNENLGPISVIDFERLGADSDYKSLWGLVIWQAPERWSWAASVYSSEVDGNKVTPEDIEFGDLLIPAGTGVSTDLTTSFLVLNGYYDLFQRPNSALAVGFGLYTLDLDAEVEAFVGNDLASSKRTSDVLAPLPTVSMLYKHAFNDKWALWADLGYFSLNIDEYDGSILAARVSVNYWFTENWGLGAGYSFVDLDLTVDKPIFDRKFDVQYDSFFLYLSSGF